MGCDSPIVLAIAATSLPLSIRRRLDLSAPNAASSVVELLAHYAAPAWKALATGLHTLGRGVLVEERKAIAKQVLADHDFVSANPGHGALASICRPSRRQGRVPFPK